MEWIVHHQHILVKTVEWLGCKMTMASVSVIGQIQLMLQFAQVPYKQKRKTWLYTLSSQQKLIVDMEDRIFTVLCYLKENWWGPWGHEETRVTSSSVLNSNRESLKDEPCRGKLINVTTQETLSKPMSDFYRAATDIRVQCQRGPRKMTMKLYTTNSKWPWWQHSGSQISVDQR